MRESKRAIERQREREFPKPKALLDEGAQLGSTPSPLRGYQREREPTEPDPVTSVPYLPSLTVRSSGICSSSSLLRSRYLEGCQSTELEY